jgi:hypothetical protein
MTSPGRQHGGDSSDAWGRILFPRRSRPVRNHCAIRDRADIVFWRLTVLGDGDRSAQSSAARKSGPVVDGGLAMRGKGTRLLCGPTYAANTSPSVTGLPVNAKSMMCVVRALRSVLVGTVRFVPDMCVCRRGSASRLLSPA